MIEEPNLIPMDLICQGQEKYITIHILRNWDRERIERFSLHLLGDECQKCDAEKKESPAIPQQPQQSICRWSLDKIDDKWDTSCGEAFVFETDGPRANGFKFCPYCGKQLAVR